MSAITQLKSLFAQKGWEAFDFQVETWEAIDRGESGLVHSATGTGKTLAVWMGLLGRALSETPPGLKVLWITPLRALAHDSLHALVRGVEEIGLDWRVELRTGDTSSNEKTKQVRDQPDALVTTPESLCLLLSRPDSQDLFQSLQAVVVDEWHELLSTKRGTQVELCLSQLRAWNPDLQTWGISATLGNLHQAMETLLGCGSEGRLISSNLPKEIVVDCLLPETMERFPWAGHLGDRMLPQVIQAIEESESCLIFTNVRSSSEIWHQSILAARPDWEGQIGLHHGSLDRQVRESVELGIKTGQLRAVVCTSSLDLGVDFSPVDRILQIGSPKGVARLLQRAGRSGHRPGIPSRVTCVPTHALELVDISSARVAIESGHIEGREAPENPLDVLCQHLVTLACGGGFKREETLRTIRRATSYRNLSESDFDWCLDYITRGGDALAAYPNFKKVGVLSDGTYLVRDKKIAVQHRLNIGTIVSDASVNVRFLSGESIGTVEEGFVARLKKGDQFLFGGRWLEFVRLKDLTCYVTKATKLKGAVPRWAGGRMPLSNELARAIRRTLSAVRQGVVESPEVACLLPLLRLQAEWSAVPDEGEILIEAMESREGSHLYFYPIEGRAVHEGMAALFAYRMSREREITMTTASNDYGFELLSDQPLNFSPDLFRALVSRDNLQADIEASLNAVEMSKRQFREIARIAGLIQQGYPGNQRSVKQVQVSSGLLHDVFVQFDPKNRLLEQSRREVLERQLEHSRLGRALDRMAASKLLVTSPPRTTPFGFPMMVDRLRETVSSESVASRIERLVQSYEQA